MKRYVAKSKKMCRYKVAVSASLEIEDEIEIEAESEDRALIDAEYEAEGLLEENIDSAEYDTEIVDTQEFTVEEYGYELDKDDYVLEYAGLMGYSELRMLNDEPFKKILNDIPSGEPQLVMFKYDLGGGGCGALYLKYNNVERNIFSRIYEEMQIVPCIRISQGSSISDEDFEKIKTCVNITINGNIFVNMNSEMYENPLFCLGKSIDISVFRKDENAPDANEYEASDVKKMIDVWVRKNL